MEGEISYIQILLPLRLEWLPFYRVPSDMGVVNVGDKVKVSFSGKTYIGVVVKTDCSIPETLDKDKIRDIECIEKGLARIRAEELKLWSQLAEYYMCTMGEVFRTVCPARKIDREEIELRKRQRIEARAQKLVEMIARARRADTRARYEAELAALTGQRSSLISDAGGHNNASASSQLECPGTTSEASLATESGAYPNAITLSEDQQEAYSRIKTAFASGKPVLLEGVTGSGKTEIYMTLALDALAEGRNVLYLVPEIALSRQLEQRLQKVFGDRLLVFHSHETISHRGIVASTVASAGGDIRCNDKSGDSNYIVLGTRSSLFLPHHDLGLIIVDEEHDNSYKQDSPAPRYNGRDVAVMMSAIQGTPLIMGSATPSLESLFNCRAGRYIKVDLTQRYHGEGDVEIEIIDTRTERRKRGMHGCFSRKLIARIGDTLAAGHQVMILRDRRSYSPAVQCIRCGDIPKCPRCNISLSLHKGPSGDRLVCHHCGNLYPYDCHCKQCGETMEGIGAGTQRVYEEACELFPSANIARLDSDVTRNAKEEERIIRNFSEGAINILIGTQIVSKGFDFENLALVAVIQADAMFAAQDFRADEKALQLLEQFKGRCARRGGHGAFVIQTSKPEHPVFERLRSGGDNAFLDEERRTFCYPPYFRLITIQFKDKFADRAQRNASALLQDIYMSIGGLGEKHIDLGDGRSTNCVNIVGPYIPPREIEDGRHLREIRISLARTKDLAEVKRLIYKAVNAYVQKSRYDGDITIDVDPL